MLTKEEEDFIDSLFEPNSGRVEEPLIVKDKERGTYGSVSLAPTTVVSFDNSEYREKPWYNTEENQRIMTEAIIKANPHFKYSWQTYEPYMFIIKGEGFGILPREGYSWTLTEKVVLSCFENQLIMSYCPYINDKEPKNPYWEMSQEAVIEMAKMMCEAEGFSEEETARQIENIKKM